jgi:hypothetical protein
MLKKCLLNKIKIIILALMIALYFHQESSNQRVRYAITVNKI